MVTPQVNDFRILVNLIHIFDSNRDIVFLRELKNRGKCLNKASENLIQKQTEMIPEVENKVFGFQLVCQFHIVQQVLFNGLSHGGLNLGRIDIRG